MAQVRAFVWERVLEKLNSVERRRKKQEVPSCKRRNFPARGNSRYQSSAEKFARPSPDRVVPPLEYVRENLITTVSPYRQHRAKNNSNYRRC
jgi:hypothetical protein